MPHVLTAARIEARRVETEGLHSREPEMPAQTLSPSTSGECMTALGAFADRIPPRRGVLVEAIRELNRTPGTLTDEQQASALEQILARRGYGVVEQMGRVSE